MKYDFIEIGTSDFDTLIQQATSEVGLSIEPINFYLDRLPERLNVTKVNNAISNMNCIVDVFWIDPKDIENYRLPQWLRGCNSIINPHPTALNELNSRGLRSLYKISKCEAITWSMLVNRYKIESVDMLKIDTEGHDCVIIKNILDSNSNVLPKKISFENNELSNNIEVQSTLNKLYSVGYKLLNFGYETTVELNQ
jgi:hypothetical protein